MANPETHVEAHYTRDDMAARILAVLGEQGVDVEALTLDDLAPLDEMHVRGREATLSLIERAGFTRDMQILDVGCGLGGPTRVLAAATGCRVTAVDLTEEFVRSAAVLAAKVGLSGQVTYRRANALALPFEDASFDGAWSQHVQMNIEDKPRLYGEIARVVQPGGRFAAYDILAGPAGPPYYPCPWAVDPAYSFLIAPEPWRGLLEKSGFVIEQWHDRTEAGLDWFARMAEKAK
ncbi:MAG: class I SAM-dependent methyltransferase, partial [Kiloniellales bacterium]